MEVYDRTGPSNIIEMIFGFLNHKESIVGERESTHSSKLLDDSEFLRKNSKGYNLESIVR
jgi:hypothetical protein